MIPGIRLHSRVAGHITCYTLRLPSHLITYSWQFVLMCYNFSQNNFFNKQPSCQLFGIHVMSLWYVDLLFIAPFYQHLIARIDKPHVLDLNLRFDLLLWVHSHKSRIWESNVSWKSCHIPLIWNYCCLILGIWLILLELQDTILTLKSLISPGLVITLTITTQFEGVFEIMRSAFKTGLCLMKQFAHNWNLPCCQCMETFSCLSHTKWYPCWD